ncbi:hypothetical protein [uncultured Methanospirillum sp.]|uniref:hypothetical protein n=1 Tax=uncultured Methanospirillum sp. TaxID=262503 RepID=UPI0029C7CF8B|nr:hypothetical protein [uncultured Methanospirillum sp.]
MSGILLFIALTLFCSITSATPAVPDLTGNWTGTSVGYDREGGYDGPSNWTFLVTIVEQRGRVFNGTIGYSNMSNLSQKGSVGFSGVMGNDLESFYLTEYGSGYVIGKIIDTDMMEFIYLESADGSAAIDTLTRVKP